MRCVCSSIKKINGTQRWRHHASSIPARAHRCRSTKHAARVYVNRGQQQQHVYVNRCDRSSCACGTSQINQATACHTGSHTSDTLCWTGRGFIARSDSMEVVTPSPCCGLTLVYDAAAPAYYVCNAATRTVARLPCYPDPGHVSSAGLGFDAQLKEYKVVR
jgi:hypothetical protein